MKNDNSYYYLYVTYNLTNKKKYIGQHCTHNMLDGYYGHNKELKKDIANGHQYQVCILSMYDNIYDLGNAEYNYIKQTNAVTDVRYYNKRNTRFYNRAFLFGLSEYTKEKIRETCKIRGLNKGEKNGMYGKGYKISGSNNGSYGKGNSKGKHWTVKNRNPAPKVTCPQCGKTGAPNTMYRFHFENCGKINEEFNKKMSAIATKRWRKIKNFND